MMNIVCGTRRTHRALSLALSPAKSPLDQLIEREDRGEITSGVTIGGRPSLVKVPGRHPGFTAAMPSMCGSTSR